MLRVLRSVPALLVRPASIGEPVRCISLPTLPRGQVREVFASGGPAHKHHRQASRQRSVSAEPSLNLALQVAEYFALKAVDTRGIAREVGQAVAQWRNVAAAVGLTPAEVDRMTSAFDHEDLKAALALPSIQ